MDFSYTNSEYDTYHNNFAKFVVVINKDVNETYNRRIRRHCIPGKKGYR
jgi:hypothetical protein